ncbi:transcription-repair coupling factor [Limnochorda pilosa]|uniref:Transcription-repair-coupling factor n=1 Tax=Limnochorda pilosa TaxID=1555112 RepID=A0A0K2SRD3_LIMPI|nr:transcription-repair coupling factor [Limnochorda pilosa]BAS29404.1 transcription-repair coupling factor [Limnochorda pilosa]
MAIPGLLHLFEVSRHIETLGTALDDASRPIWLPGLSEGEKCVVLAALWQRLRSLRKGASALWIASSAYQAERVYEQLSSLLPAGQVQIFPALDTLPDEEARPSAELTGRRMAALSRLAAGRPTLVVAPVDAAAGRMVPAEIFRSLPLPLRVGVQVPLEEVPVRLAAMGYQREARVEGPGAFAIRGDILDVFPGGADAPIRVELAGDEVESIRAFDPATQRSAVSLQEALVPPLTECPLPPDGREEPAERIRQAWEAQAARLEHLGRRQEAEAARRRGALHADRLARGEIFDGMAQYLAFFHPAPATLLDHLGHGLVVLDEPDHVKDRLNQWHLEIGEQLSQKLEAGRALPGEAGLFLEWPDLLAAARRHPLACLSSLNKRLVELEPSRSHRIEMRSPDLYHGRMDQLSSQIRRWAREGNRVLLVLATEDRARRAVDALREQDVPALFVPSVVDELKPGNAVATVGTLHAGLVYGDLKLVVLSDLEVIGQAKRRRRLGVVRRDEDGAHIDELPDLRPGDFVVHVNHGIGRYVGLETLAIGDVHKDYLVVEYAGNDRLYVPTDQLDLLQKYIGADGQAPRIYKLGGSEWARVKKRVKESVREMAEGLLKLYAEREAARGFHFSPDTVWQAEFEDAFPYEETLDQLRAIREVKRDMEHDRPMDRLLCGDVGFGKTEVAIRAAFKAVMDGKQVVVLVPTTILAQQHHRTFRERFERYPVGIATLSRFQTPGEQKAVLDGLRTGAIDVVIGTHRLLSRDVVFKDLGLVVVDEEQRFGVAQKERLKELRTSVDVLTLTATPIPRTLHMALAGVRDMSVIETPPEDRTPVRTYVVEYDPETVREAILRELARQGQVYFVYNHVQSIDRKAREIQELVPEARVAVAHGQMEENRLERVMLDFLEGEYDVLVCSTIIETGMDIANVNTLIVWDADRMGLAQLYQLRGRVGRSNRVAYAYFTYRPEKILSEDAEKRLQALREFTDLGSGFKIAMRDLEIRGAGNLLGPEQHGFIASVGFELYTRLLAESIRELRGTEAAQPPEPVLDLNVDAYVNEGYIGDSQQKVEVYKKVVGIRTLEEADELAAELTDRFGPPPEPVTNLLTVARVKVLARELGVSSVSAQGDRVHVRWHQGLRLPYEGLLPLTRKYRGRLALVPARTSQLTIRRYGMGDAELLGMLEGILADLRESWPVASGQ